MYRDATQAAYDTITPTFTLAEVSEPSAGARQDGTVPSLIACPDCGLPAEITERFVLASTDGPVDHVALLCVADHFFKMAVDRLPADARVFVQ